MKISTLGNYWRLKELSSRAQEKLLFSIILIRMIIQ